jgi:hypothetical protein
MANGALEATLRADLHEVLTVDTHASFIAVTKYANHAVHLRYVAASFSGPNIGDPARALDAFALLPALSTLILHDLSDAPDIGTALVRLFQTTATLQNFEVHGQCAASAFKAIGEGGRQNPNFPVTSIAIEIEEVLFSAECVTEWQLMLTNALRLKRLSLWSITSEMPCLLPTSGLPNLTWLEALTEELDDEWYRLLALLIRGSPSLEYLGFLLSNSASTKATSDFQNAVDELDHPLLVKCFSRSFLSRMALGLLAWLNDRSVYSDLAVPWWYNYKLGTLKTKYLCFPPFSDCEKTVPLYIYFYRTAYQSSRSQSRF